MNGLNDGQPGQDYRSKNLLPFDYVITLALSSGGSLVSNLVFAQDSQFELHQWAASSSADTDADVMPNNFSVLVTDLATGRSLSNLRVPQRAWAAPANPFYRLVRPVIFPPAANLQFDALDLSSGTNTVTIVLRGFKLFLPVQ